MGSRKKIAADARKEQRKSLYLASLNNCPTSPRKMRLIADIVRGKDVEQALSILKHKPNDAAGRLYKLVLSAIANWQEKNEGVRIEDQNLYIKSVMVDSARVLKRIRPAPQGRAHRIRKRSNHVTVVLDSRNQVIADNQ
jgi:large subunit ribosomal protein L22